MRRAGGRPAGRGVGRGTAGAETRTRGRPKPGGARPPGPGRVGLAVGLLRVRRDPGSAGPPEPSLRDGRALGVPRPEEAADPESPGAGRGAAPWAPGRKGVEPSPSAPSHAARALALHPPDAPWPRRREPSGGAGKGREHAPARPPAAPPRPDPAPSATEDALSSDRETRWRLRREDGPTAPEQWVHLTPCDLIPRNGWKNVQSSTGPAVKLLLPRFRKTCVFIPRCNTKEGVDSTRAPPRRQEGHGPHHQGTHSLSPSPCGEASLSWKTVTFLSPRLYRHTYHKRV